MSGVHKHPTISFRVSDREREMIEARILASGMQKKDYFVRSCIYNRICVVGKKEVIYKLVEELQNMQTNISELVKQLEQQDVTLTADGLEDMRNDSMDMLQAIISMLDGAKYLWQGAQTNKEKVLTAATVRTCGNKRKPLLPMYSQLEYSRGSS